jgi:transposase
MRKKKTFIEIPINKITTSKYFIPLIHDKTKVSSHSWFDIETYDYGSNQEVNSHVIQTQVMRAKQIKINTNTSQKHILLEWIEHARIVYNMTVKYLKHNAVLCFNKLRAMIKSLFSKIFKHRLTNTPCHIIDNSIKDVLKARKTAMALLKAGYIKKFRLRSKKQAKPIQTIVIEKQDFSKKVNSFYVKTMGLLNTSNPIIHKFIEHDCRLSFDKNKNIFLLHSPIKKETTSCKTRYRTCGIDGGLKTFLTVYNPDKECLKIMNRDRTTKLSRLIRKKISLMRLTRTSKAKRATLRVNRKIYNNVKELHYKSANLLVNSYDNIYLGKLSTQNIIKGKTLSPFDKQFALALSHFTFYNILKNKCEELSKNLFYVDESYTSKTCGSCGNLYNIDKSRVYTCDKCHGVFDRDMNSARLILIKNEC